MNIAPEKIIAYFQPILSACSRQVYSYEILGRRIDDNGNVLSLGPIFNDPNTANEDALWLDRIVRRYAMQKYAEEKRNEYLFINIRLAWLTKYADKPEEMLTLQWAKEFGISPEKLVIEITEEEFNAGDAYVSSIVHYKNVGCRIALDDYGKQASNIERLAILKPDIIKINMDYIHNSEKSYHYREYLRSIAKFAESVGIEVLYEGIETERQLDICTSLKGRYYQGFLISRPQASMRDAVVNNAVLSTSIEHAYMDQQDLIVKTENLHNNLDARLEKVLKENLFDGGKTDYQEYLAKIFQGLSNPRLIYLCNKQGDQLGRNAGIKAAEVNPNDYAKIPPSPKINWAWRGYFYEILKSLAIGQKSSLSGVYYDFTTKDKIRTYSYAITDDVFLFIDIDAE